MNEYPFFENAYFIIGTAYAGKSTMVKELAGKHKGIACTENYHDDYPEELDMEEFPCLTYTRDLKDWPDPEKQFLYKLIMEEPDPEYALLNYRKGLELINSKEAYDKLLNSGFNVILRDENRTIEETLVLAEKTLGLV